MNEQKNKGLLHILWNGKDQKPKLLYFIFFNLFIIVKCVIYMCKCNLISDRLFITIMRKVGNTEHSMIYKGSVRKAVRRLKGRG